MPSGMTEILPGGMPRWRTISSRENCRVGQHDRWRGAPTRPRASCAAILRAREPLRVRGERHVVNGQRHRARRGERRACSRAQQHVRPVGGQVRAARPTVPSGCRRRRRDATRLSEARRCTAAAGRDQSATRGGGPRRTPPTRRAVPTVPADAGRTSRPARGRRRRSSSRGAPRAPAIAARYAVARRPAHGRPREAARPVRARRAPSPPRASPGRASAPFRAASAIGSSGSTGRAAVPATSGSEPRFETDHRHAAGHRLEHRQAEAFLERRKHQHDRARDRAVVARHRSRNREG